MRNAILPTAPTTAAPVARTVLFAVNQRPSGHSIMNTFNESLRGP
jgi:hypothetical protein